MLVFATSDKGGTGRSVTSCNIAYQRALQGGDVAYVDFDFGSPTAGSIFNITTALRGTTEKDGLHTYLSSEKIATPRMIDVWRESDRRALRGRPDGAGRLVLLPGDEGGGEFVREGEYLHDQLVARCVGLFARLDEEFELTIVDLSAGRSIAAQLCLEATREPVLQNVEARWLVFHRWTRQHVIAAAGLVQGENGIVEAGERLGHDPGALRRAIRFVRTAVVDPRSDELAGLMPSQIAWLNEIDGELRELAGIEGVGRSNRLGDVPLDPVLQWREQLISDEDHSTRKIASSATAEAFRTLAERLDEEWVGL